jgi:hypothetical protein
MRQMIEAFAIVTDDGVILPETVFATERGAMVNYLYAKCNVMLTRDWNEERISETFNNYARRHKVSVAPVKVIRSA